MKFDMDIFISFSVLKFGGAVLDFKLQAADKFSYPGYDFLAWYNHLMVMVDR